MKTFSLRLLSFFFIMSLVSPGFASENERIVISQWLSLGPLALETPLFHDHINTRGDVFSDRDLLVFPHIDMASLRAVEGESQMWKQGMEIRWTKAPTDENGYLVFSSLTLGEQPELAFMAAYIRLDKWTETELEIKSPYLLEAWLNGRKIGTKASQEKEEGSIGRVSQKLKLEPGTHQLLIKSLRPGGEGLDWKVMANLSLSDGQRAEDIALTTDPLRIKSISDILDGVRANSVEFSPDGSLYAVSFSQSLPPSDQSESWTEIRRLSDGKRIHSFRHARISRLNWLPRSNAISYTSVREGKTSLHYHHMESGEQKLLAENLENFTGMRWAPDESYIIYSLREEGSGSDDNMRQVLGMQDRQAHWRHRSHLYQLDVSSGTHRRLSWGRLSASLHDISPDGKKLLFSQSEPDYQSRPFTRSHLILFDLQSFQADTLLADQRWSVSARFSPDGRQLLATGGPSAFDGAGEMLPPQTIANNYDTQAYLFDLQSRRVKAFTRGFDPSVSSVYWHEPTGLIYLLTVDQDYQRVYTYDPARERFNLLDTGFEYVTSMDFAANGRRAVFRGNQANSPHAFHWLDLRNNRLHELHFEEDERWDHVSFGEVKDWDYTTTDDVFIKGRYYLPPDFDPSQTYPVIVYYYAGTTPVGRTFGGRYPFNLWAGHGFVVYVLQPSGSIGFGQAFSAAHVNNWGITVADEIIESTQAFLKAHPFTDPERVGCAGASYGGFMTMLLMTRTDMFATAISHAGISSISSYWGEGLWGYAYSAEATAESFPWNSPEIYVNQSPLFFADRIHTPLLLITGDADTNVPPGESIQLFTALKMLDRPVELVLVKGEDHHIVTYNRRIEWHNTIMAWWHRYLKDQPQWWDELYPQSHY